MRSFTLLFCLIPVTICARNFSLENQLKQAMQDKEAEMGITVIIDGKGTATVNNRTHYPLMSVFKFHRALALADCMGKQQQSLNFKPTIKKEDPKPDTYSLLQDDFPQEGFNIDIADLLKYILRQNDSNAYDTPFQYQGGVDAVNQYIHSLGVTDYTIVCTGNDMYQDESLCYQNWIVPLAVARLSEIFRKEALFLQEYKDLIYQTMTECQTGQDRLVVPLLGKEVTIGHRTGTGDRDAKGQQVVYNDIGLILLPDGRAYGIAVFIKDSEENSQGNSKIIANISRTVYEYMTHQ